jgi:hypothetical protein
VAVSAAFSSPCQEQIQIRVPETTIRVKVVHGKKSMSWAKSVLPVFMSDSSEKFRLAPGKIQIDTTDFCPQAPAKSTFSRTHIALNWTAVIYCF